MELIFVVGFVAVIVLIPWTVWKMWTREQRLEKATKKATLEQAWHYTACNEGSSRSMILRPLCTWQRWINA